MNHEDLLGPWKLKSMEGKNAEGESFHPYGETPTGMILYDASGTMSYTVMRLGRPKFTSKDTRGGTPAEIMAAYEGFDAYCGRYDIDPDRGVIIHHIEACKYPNWEQSDQVRRFQISGNQLLIEAGPIRIQGADWKISVVFERP